MTNNGPRFLGLGGAKCGTTTLAEHLRAHPAIFMPSGGRKELHFFDEAEVDEHSVATYRRQFAGDRMSGEITPSYLFDPRCPPLVRRWLGPDIRFLVLLRDPVQRAWSHWSHAVRVWPEARFRKVGYPIESLWFEDAIEAEPTRLASGRFHIRHLSYLSKGLYADQLERWFEQFDRDHFWVGLTEDLHADPQGTIDAVSDHLGVERSAVATPQLQLNSQSLGRPPGGVRRRLVERFAQDIERTGALIGRDLSRWLS